MDQVYSSSNSVLDTLLKTNRPFTDEEKAMILESMAPTNAKVKVVEWQISEAMARIQMLRSQIEEVEISVQHLHEEKAAILATCADHRRALGCPFRNLPEEVLRTTNILLHTLLGHSTRWREVELYASSLSSRSMNRIATLTAADVPLLQSVSLRLDGDMPVLHNSIFLTMPTLKHLALHTDHVPKFTVNWEILTSLTLHEKSRSHRSSQGEIARTLQQTKCLRFCNIAVGRGSVQDYPGEINLPLLETLFLNEVNFRAASSGASQDAGT
ncbi:hypothetical protein HYPSUDRAFT_908951 [Hypholoma sublateritium FD-334 SS-4]|uniref:F-box domain-containing protein n=1 Tax=Hypholoma sublateritium (strain FD-334 SS-4) TaxID=945553 RepID=A0A0D2KWJ0_HYPSF|nr:hypothetical protein HYPSUDRAFT_908951 [Hypholoma sublateritium FD-334 SS-4]